jgi:hypothetical protein
VLAAPPGGGTKPLLPIPKISVNPPPEVAAMAAARRQREINNNSNADLPPATKKPFYPSADPSRLGSKAS